MYQAARPRVQVLRAMVREFVERVFGGATEPLLVHLLEDRRLTRADLDGPRSPRARGTEVSADALLANLIAYSTQVAVVVAVERRSRV